MCVKKQPCCYSCDNFRIQLLHISHRGNRSKDMWKCEVIAGYGKSFRKNRRKIALQMIRSLTCNYIIPDFIPLFSLLLFGPMELANQVYETQILPLLSPLISKVSGSQAYAVARRNKTLSIGAAVALTVVYMAYSTVTRPPKHLRHIPSANNIKLLKAYLSGWPINDIATKITIPAALQSDRNIYVVSKTSSFTASIDYFDLCCFLLCYFKRYDINGWMVRIQDPVAAKKFLLKTGEWQLTIRSHVTQNNKQRSLLQISFQSTAYRKHAMEQSMVNSLENPILSLFPVINGNRIGRLGKQYYFLQKQITYSIVY